MSFFDLTICVPAYNESEIIYQVIADLKESFEGAEIIVVDDGSTDVTAEMVKKAGVKLISHSRNIGYGAALKTAMRNSGRSVIAWYDSDGQHRPEDLMRVVAPVLNNEKDAVIGSRGANSAVIAERVAGKILLKFVAEIVAGCNIPDLNSGMRCFRKEVVMRYLHLLPDGFSASSTTTMLMIKRGYRLDFVEITTLHRVGKSTVKMLSDGWRTIQLLLRILVLFEAFNFFCVLALLQIIPSSLYGFIIALIHGKGVPILAATFFISGITTFFMGIICDQITALRKEKFEL